MMPPSRCWTCLFWPVATNVARRRPPRRRAARAPAQAPKPPSQTHSTPSADHDRPAGAAAARRGTTYRCCGHRGVMTRSPWLALPSGRSAGSGRRRAAGGASAAGTADTRRMQHLAREVRRLPARPARRIRTLSTLFSSAGRCVMTTTVTRLSLARLQRLGQRLLARGIEIGVGLVQHHQRRIAEEGAGQRDALLLAARERRAAALEHGLVAAAAAARSCRARR